MEVMLAVKRQYWAAKLRRVLAYLLKTGVNEPPTDWDAVYTVDRALWEVKYHRNFKRMRRINELDMRHL